MAPLLSAHLEQLSLDGSGPVRGHVGLRAKFTENGFGFAGMGFQDWI